MKIIAKTREWWKKKYRPDISAMKVSLWICLQVDCMAWMHNYCRIPQRKKIVTFPSSDNSVFSLLPVLRQIFWIVFCLSLSLSCKWMLIKDLISLVLTYFHLNTFLVFAKWSLEWQGRGRSNIHRFSCCPPLYKTVQKKIRLFGGAHWRLEELRNVWNK